MISLLIDTAFETCQIGLWKNDTCITMASVPGGGKHDVILAPLVEEMLRVHEVKIKDLQKIIVTTGPGRFTGLRVGIAFARGLALVHKTPVRGVLTTDALQWDMQHAAPGAQAMAAIVTVKRGESFIQRFKPGLQPIERVMDEALKDYFSQDREIILAGVIAPETRALLGETETVHILENITEPSLPAIFAASRAGMQKNSPVRPYYAL